MIIFKNGLRLKGQITIKSAALAPPTKLLVGGDSLWYGSGSSDYKYSYRGILSYHIYNNNYNIDIVGTKGPTGTMPDADHCAAPGASIGTIGSNLISDINFYGGISQLDFNGGEANLSNTGASGAAVAALYSTQLNNIYNTMQALNPGSKIAVHSPIPIQPGQAGEDRLVDYKNALIPVWDAFDAANPTNILIRRDMFTAIGGVWDSSKFYDMYHPNDLGHSLMASELLNLSYRTYLRNLSPGIINSLACTITTDSSAIITTEVPFNITGTMSRSSYDCAVVVKNGSTVLGTATPNFYTKTWTYNWIPDSGDIGTITLNAVVTDNIDFTTANAIPVNVTVQAAPSDPLAIITSVNFLTWNRADLGVTEGSGVGTGVSIWANQSFGAMPSFTQSGATSIRPTLNTSDGYFNNQATITGDGINDYIFSAYNFPAPGTTPLWICIVLRQISWTAGRNIYGNNSTTIRLQQTGISPQLFMLNGSAGPGGTGATIGSAARVTNFYNNSTTDYIKAGANTYTGSNSGNIDPSINFYLFARNAATYSNVAIAEIIICDGNPTLTEQSNLDAYFVGRYGISLLV